MKPTAYFVTLVAVGIALWITPGKPRENTSIWVEQEQQGQTVSTSDVPTGLDGRPGYDPDVECAISDSISHHQGGPRCKGRI